MSAEEISRLVKALSELGFCKIRLTGEEPTVVQGTCWSSKKPKSWTLLNWGCWTTRFL